MNSIWFAKLVGNLVTGKEAQGKWHANSTTNQWYHHKIVPRELLIMPERKRIASNREETGAGCKHLGKVHR